MGRKHITADGQRYELDEGTTVAELKAQVGAADNDLATYVDEDGSWGTLSDRDQVKHIPEEATVAFQPKNTYFGGRR